jgi:MFS transporter, YQGE family, putative transporter
MQNESQTRLKTSIEYHLGLIGIPSSTKKFIFTHFNFLLFTTIPGVFINTFFFRQDGKISTVAIFNAILYLGTASVMQLSSKISLKKSPVFVMRIGLAIYNIFYISLLLSQSNASKYMLILAAENAIASAFYWQGYNELIRAYTSEKIFDKSISLIGLSSAVVTLIVPILSGFLISYCPGQFGYSLIFAMSFISSLFTTYLTLKLEKVEVSGESNLPGVYRFILSNRKLTISFIAELVRGMRNTTFPLFLSIIYFKFVSNESLLGVNSMLCGIASILSFLIAGRIVRPTNRLRCILTAAIVSVIVFLPLLFVMNSTSIFILAIVNSFIVAYIDNPSTAFFYSLFQKPVKGITFSQVMAAHEVFLAVGRVIGIALLVVFSQSSVMLAILVLILNFSTILVWALLRLIKKMNKADEEQEALDGE